MAGLEEVTQAIQLEGGDEIVNTLERIGSLGEEAFAKIEAALSSGAGGFAAFTEGLVGLGAALAAATAATVAFVESQDHAITAISALASSFGTTVSGIQGIKEGFEQAGVSGTMLERGLGRMQRTIGQQWSEISREVRDSASSQARDQQSIQSAVLGTQKAIESLSEAEEKLTYLGTQQAQERVRVENSVADAFLKNSTLLEQQTNDTLSATNAVEAASQKLRDLRQPGSVQQSEKDRLKKAEAEEALAAAQERQRNLSQKQVNDQIESAARLAEAQEKQRELAQKQMDEQIKAENAAKEAVLEVQKAKLAEAEAAEKAYQHDLKNLPLIATQLNSIAAGYGDIKGAIDLTQVSAMNLSKAVILAAGGIDGLNRPQGIEIFNKLSDVFKGLGTSADAMAIKVEIVQRMLAAGFRGGGAGMAEMIAALDKGSGAFAQLQEKIEKSGYALTELDTKNALQTQSAFATLEDTFLRVGEKLAAMASPTVTEWLNGIKNSLEDADGVLHVFISGIESIGAAVGKLITWVKDATDALDHMFNAESGTALRTAFIGIGIAIAAVMPLLAGIPVAIGLIVFAVGELQQHWESVKAAAAVVYEYIVNEWAGGIIGKIGDVIAWIDRMAAAWGKARPPGGGAAGAATTATGAAGGQWQGGPAGAFAEGGLVQSIMSAVSAVRRFADGGGAVNGPGSGTSDSILARLSNGEFVMRAAAVRAYGSDLMHAINNMQFPGFAMGGPVLAGVPVSRGNSNKPSSVLNLTIDGQRFDGLRAPQDVAEKLSRFAISRQTSSTGRKPSWME